MALRKILIALDSFKGSLSSLAAGEALASGIVAADAAIRTIVYSIADGGEGTMECLAANCGGSLVTVTVQGPLGQPVAASYCILPGKIAVIEMAKASGLTLIPPAQRNPLLTSSYGTGQLIAHALDQGISEIIFAIGGSATNDAGMGMLAALGMKFLDQNNAPLRPVGGSLGEIAGIDSAQVHPRLKSCQFTVACDVNNVLYGEQGAAYVYAPQKGADAAMVKQLDGYLRHFAHVIRQTTGQDIAHFPGAGAAGGIAAGLAAFAPTQLRSGIEIVLDHIGIDQELATADLVFVGEGQLDRQTAMGKAPMGVSKRAQKYAVPVVAIGGALDGDPVSLHQESAIAAYFAAVARPMSLETAMTPAEASAGLHRQGRELIRLINLFLK